MVLFNAFKSAPAANQPHALRWFNHLKSFGDGKSKLPGVKKALSDFGVTGGAAPAAKAAAADDDDDVDLFGSDDEVDEAAEKLKQERLAAYAAKKSKSKCPKTSDFLISMCYIVLLIFVEPATIAKSNVILDVKPWDDETNMADLEAAVRTIQMDGLVWGVSKLVPLAYGIKKLQIVCVVEGKK